MLDQSLSAVLKSFFNIFAATLHIVGLSLFRNLWAHHAVVTETVLEVGCGCLDWIDLAQDRDNWRAHIVLAQSVGNFMNSCEPVGFTRRPAAWS